MTSDDVQASRRASDTALVELIATMKASDSVELKMTVASDEHRATIATLPIDPVEAQPRQIFFFDTPDLRLNQVGVVVRARRVAGGRADTVVKLRPVVPTEISDELRRSPAFNVEVDVLPGAFGVCSGALKARLTGAEVRDAVRGDIPLRKLFTKEQKAFYREHAPEGIELDDLSVLGPTFVLKSVFQPVDFDRRRVVAELWLYPDGSRILEISTKCLPGEAFQVAAEARGYLAAQGINVDAAPQQTKTKTALEFFSRHLLSTAEPVAGTGIHAALGGEADDADADVLAISDATDLDDEA